MQIHQEAYLDYLYETHFKIEALYLHPEDQYFRSTGEILEYIKVKKNALET